MLSIFGYMLNIFRNEIGTLRFCKQTISKSCLSNYTNFVYNDHIIVVLLAVIAI